MTDLDRYVALMEKIQAAGTAARWLLRARALQRLARGEPLESVGLQMRFARRYLETWEQAIRIGGFYSWLGKPEPNPDRIERARAGIAQMLLGTLAEEHFETVSVEVLGDKGFNIDDQRVRRSDTDYRLKDSEDRPVCRFNIKFHGTLFRESQEYVGLEPEDCFALAAYKIHGALRRQDEERVPYVFLIITVPEIPRSEIERRISEDYAWLAAISDRATEEAIVQTMAAESWVEDIRRQVRASEFRAISARRASILLREKLFERVHALRLRAFCRTFQGAEINMHLSLSQEMMRLRDLLSLLAEKGVLDLTVRLDRGEI